MPEAAGALPAVAGKLPAALPASCRQLPAACRQKVLSGSDVDDCQKHDTSDNRPRQTHVRLSANSLPVTAGSLPATPSGSLPTSDSPWTHFGLFFPGDYRSNRQKDKIWTEGGKDCAAEKKDGRRSCSFRHRDAFQTSNCRAQVELPRFLYLSGRVVLAVSGLRKQEATQAAPGIE